MPTRSNCRPPQKKCISTPTSSLRWLYFFCLFSVLRPRETRRRTTTLYPAKPQPIATTHPIPMRSSFGKAAPRVPLVTILAAISPSFTFIELGREPSASTCNPVNSWRRLRSSNRHERTGSCRRLLLAEIGSDHLCVVLSPGSDSWNLSLSSSDVGWTAGAETDPLPRERLRRRFKPGRSFRVFRRGTPSCHARASFRYRL